jgi:hypothetical protein
MEAAELSGNGFHDGADRDEDLRKTARGASSPAKPALHIPELPIVSSVHFYHTLSSRALPEGASSLLCDGVGTGGADKPLHSRDDRVRFGGPNSPIVDDEGCDFLCRGRHGLAELIEIDSGWIGDDRGRGGWGELLTLHVD